MVEELNTSFVRLVIMNCLLGVDLFYCIVGGVLTTLPFFRLLDSIRRQLTCSALLPGKHVKEHIKEVWGVVEKAI